MSKASDTPGTTSPVREITGIEARRARDQLLQKISADGNLPAIGSLILRIVQLASSDDQAVHNLATYVLSDVALTQKILRIANTVNYRPSAGNQVTTISRAIFVLGFETIKTTALALLLVDGMVGQRGESVRAELAQALACSAVARELARRSHYRDTEEAAVAALFMNIGQVLVASYDHYAYKQVDTLVKAGRTPVQAAMQVLGCSYTMLAEAVLRDWSMPETIVLGLTPLPLGAQKLAKSRHEWMQQVAGFSEMAGKLLLAPPARGDRSGSRALLARFGAALQIDGVAYDDIMAAALREVRALSGSADLASLTESLSAARLEIAEKVEQQDEVEGLPAELILSVAPPPDAQIGERHASGKPINARDLLLTGVRDVTEMMASGRCKLNDLILLVLETLYHGLGCRFATICLKDAKTGQYRARISLGDKNATTQLGFTFPAGGANDIFTLAMENDADLMITDARVEKIAKLIPQWHKQLLPDARSFIVLPLVVRDKPVGFFYADRRRPAEEGVPSDETALIKTLKGQVLVALNNHGG